MNGLKPIPIYEVVKVLKQKVFIVGLGDPPITENLELVYEECKKQFPNKQIIFYDDISDRDIGWYEMFEAENQDEVDYEITYEITFWQYIAKIPKIKVWDEILGTV